MEPSELRGKQPDELQKELDAGQNVTANTNFKNAIAYQAPFSARIGAKLSF